jgi:hypothetical protein
MARLGGRGVERYESARHFNIVIPAKAGIQRLFHKRHWVRAFAGTTSVLRENRHPLR